MRNLLQAELMLKLLFDPRIEPCLSELRECLDPLYLSSEPDVSGLKHSWIDEIKEVSTYQEIADDVNVDLDDFTALPDFLDRHFEQMLDLNKGILHGFNRVVDVGEFNKQIEETVYFFKPFYSNLHEKRIRQLIAVALKFPKIDVYRALIKLANIEKLRYQRVYMIGDETRRRIFVELPLRTGMTSDEAKQAVIEYLTSELSLRKEKIPSDILFAWFCWITHSSGMPHEKILIKWEKEYPNEANYYDKKQVIRAITYYKDTYPDYFN